MHKWVLVFQAWIYNHTYTICTYLLCKDHNYVCHFWTTWNVILLTVCSNDTSYMHNWVWVFQACIIVCTYMQNVILKILRSRDWLFLQKVRRHKNNFWRNMVGVKKLCDCNYSALQTVYLQAFCVLGHETVGW